MRLLLIMACGILCFYSNVYAAGNGTICFSQSDCSDKYPYATLGDSVKLCGGDCQGRTLQQMYDDGWRLIQVVGGLQSSFGFIFDKEPVKLVEQSKVKNKK